MILTQKFFTDNNVCEAGQVVVDEYNLIGMDIDLAIKTLLQADLKNDAGFILEIKNSEYYVKNNGGIFTMGAYQVFNPLTGQHTRYKTEEEAKIALVEISKQVLDLHCPRVVQELSNENGDTTWIPTEIHKTIVVS
jgi:hypothetical protein